MTQRYDLLLKAIQTTNSTILTLALFALGMVAAWYVLDWTPHWMRRPAKYLYIACMLALSLLTTVYFGQG